MTTTVKQICTQFNNGISSDLFGVTNALGTGVYQTPLSYYEIIAATPSATLVVNAVAPPNPAGSLTQSFTLNSTNLTYNNANILGIQLDCVRGLNLVTSVTQTSAQNIRIVGYDINNNLMTKQVQIGTGAAPQTVVANFGFYFVTGVYVVPGSGTAFQGTLSVGTNDYLGLPNTSLLKIEHIISAAFNGTVMTPVLNSAAQTAGTIGVFTANNWRTTAPTNITADPRGMILLPTAPNGAELFAILYRPYGADSNLQAQLANNYYTAYTMLGQASVTAAVRPANTPPYELVAEDEVGVQYGLNTSVTPNVAVYNNDPNLYNVLLNIPV